MLEYAGCVLNGGGRCRRLFRRLRGDGLFVLGTRRSALLVFDILVDAFVWRYDTYRFWFLRWRGNVDFCSLEQRTQAPALRNSIASLRSILVLGAQVSR